MFLIIALLVIYSILPVKNNYKLYAVMSGSMRPTIPVGALVISKAQGEYKVGDIVTFRPPGAKTKGETVTHRVVKETITDNGQVKYVTKGDANSIEDQNSVAKDQIIGKERFSIALIGYILGYVKTLPGLFILIIIPAVIIIYDELRKIKEEFQRIIKKRKLLKHKGGKDSVDKK